LYQALYRIEYEYAYNTIDPWRVVLFKHLVKLLAEEVITFREFDVGYIGWYHGRYSFEAAYSAIEKGTATPEELLCDLSQAIIQLATKVDIWKMSDDVSKIIGFKYFKE